MQHIVDLSTVANEPYLIQQASLEFNQTIRDIATQEQWDAQYQELMPHAQGLIDRADKMQDLIASAVFFIDGAASDDEWIAYYKEVCQQASWTLDEVKQRCQVFLNDFQDYQPLDHAEVD